MTDFILPADTALILENGASAITTERTGQYSGSPRSFNHGTGVTFNGFVVFDIDAITSGGDRTYTAVMENSNASDFASGVTQMWSVQFATTGQRAFPYTNVVGVSAKTYSRVRLIPAGSGPSITLNVWLLPDAAIDDMTKANLVKFMGVVVAQWQNASFDFRAWAAGDADGGPNGDGQYPLRDADGTEHLVDCPARIAADAGGALTEAGIMALTRHVTVPAPGYTSPEVVGLINGPDGDLRRFPLDLFAARRTRDLEPLVTLISDELIPSYSASTGLERSIALGELMRQTMGMINPQHYGVRSDCRSTRHGFSFGAGDNLLVCDDPIFSAYYVGKYIQVGGAFGGGQAGQGTIISYINAYQVRVSFTFGVDGAGQDGNFGTLNTVAMQNAIIAAFNPYGGYNYGSIVMMPQGAMLTGCLYYLPRMGIIGHGSRQSSFVRWADAVLSEPGEFPRWDGDMNQWPYTTYTDGSYYIPIYPNVYKAPYYAGSYAPEVAPTLCNRIGVDAWGNEWSFNDTGYGEFSKRGQKVNSDFNVFNDFSMDGSRYCSTRFMSGLEFRGGLFDDTIPGQPAAPYLQVDPYLRCRDLTLFLHGGTPFRTFGQCSGIISGIDSEENNMCGYEHNAFDCNISNCYFMGNNGPGIVAGGSNTNWTTMKVSFNADGANEYIWGAVGGKANLYITGIGHNFNNLRVQESYGSNVAVFGRGVEFTGTHMDDTGCVYPVHIAGGNPTTIAANMNWVTPAIFVGPQGKDLRLNDVGMGGLVHVGDNYASHAVFWAKDGSNLGENTSGRMFTKSVGSWYNSGHVDLVGDYAPNEWGAEGGVPPAGTDLLLNSVDITTL